MRSRRELRQARREGPADRTRPCARARRDGRASRHRPATEAELLARPSPRSCRRRSKLDAIFSAGTPARWSRSRCSGSAGSRTCQPPGDRDDLPEPRQGLRGARRRRERRLQAAAPGPVRVDGQLLRARRPRPRRAARGAALDRRGVDEGQRADVLEAHALLAQGTGTSTSSATSRGATSSRATCDVVVTDGFTGNVRAEAGRERADATRRQLQATRSEREPARAGSARCCSSRRSTRLRKAVRLRRVRRGAAARRGRSDLHRARHARPRAPSGARIRTTATFVEQRVNEHIQELLRHAYAET